MVSARATFRRQVWLAVILIGFAPLREGAAFSAFVPLSQSGQVSYRYSYTDSAGSQTESTNLLLGWSASGYIWQPWFATSSLALNVGLSNSVSNTSSSEGTVGSGNFTVGVFPSSRFPFSLTYSRTDSRTQQSYDFTPVSGDSSFRVTRLTMRQVYRPRRSNQLYNAWYDTTRFDGGGFGSLSSSYGVDFQSRGSSQSITASANHSESGVRGASGDSKTDVFSASYTYTPNTELGVNTLFSHVIVSPQTGDTQSTDSQLFGSFAWRPEHRVVSVSGGIRMSEVRNDGATSTVSRSLNTSLGLSYRVSRALNVNLSATVGTSDSGSTQSLSTTETANMSYTGKNRRWDGYTYSWQWSGGVSNASTTVDSAGTSTSSSRQNVSTGIGHNLSKMWMARGGGSFSASFSQSGSGSKSSERNTTTKTLTHGLGFGWNGRGRRGSTYISARLGDSRSFSEKDSVFNNLTVTYASDMRINRLSSVNGNASFQGSRSVTEDDQNNELVTTAKNLTGSLSYQHSRPFGVYNLTFDSRLQASKQIGSEEPTTTWRWLGDFRYSLGLLATTLSFRVSEGANGNLIKSMNFQATRSF
ncbi:MAG TPA: hypothetical protein ENI97_00295 [Gammaproteobacteria bacterium]|nr:hypothetical protein [Gammaproteobacteria bacterium]